MNCPTRRKPAKAKVKAAHTAISSQLDIRRRLRIWIRYRCVSGVRETLSGLLESSVHYRTPAAPKMAGPWPYSPACLAIQSGAGCLVLEFIAPASCPTYSPARSPLKIDGAIGGPVYEMSGNSPHTGEGAGTTINISPLACALVKPWEGIPTPSRPTPPRNEHYCSLAKFPVLLSPYDDRQMQYIQFLNLTNMILYLPVRVSLI